MYASSRGAPRVSEGQGARVARRLIRTSIDHGGVHVNNNSERSARELLMAAGGPAASPAWTSPARPADPLAVPPAACAAA